MNYNLLSLSQTPPLWVPLRYFLTAPLFLIIAGLLLLLAPDTLFVNRWQPSVLALTHLLTLGFLGLCMLGALQQLIPVLLGVVLPRPQVLSWLLYGLWLPGTVLLVAGMYWGWRGGLQGGGMLLGLAVLLLIVSGGPAIWRTASRHATVPAMALAMLALLASVVLILWLLWRFHWQAPLAHPLSRLHIAWATLLWIGVLIIGVAYQVVPMFQLTAPYPAGLRRVLVPLLTGLVLAWSLWPQPWLSGLVALTLATFAIVTLWLQQHRRRQLADVTLDFWRVAMGALLLTSLGWLWSLYRPDAQFDALLGALFLAGFATAAVNGMLYKIVPFLIWLHLNNRLQQGDRWQGAVPNMKHIIPQRQARRQWWCYLLALLALVTAALGITPPWLAGLAWIANGGYLLWNLLGALRRYHQVLCAA